MHANIIVVTFAMQIFRPTLISSFYLAVLLVIDACVSHDFPEYSCNDSYSFSVNIRPIIENKCAISGCHNGDLGQGLNWTFFQSFHERAESGLVKYRVTHRIMPPDYSPAGPLSQEQINAIACWTDQGSLDN